MEDIYVTREEAIKALGIECSEEDITDAMIDIAIDEMTMSDYYDECGKPLDYDEVAEQLRTKKYIDVYALESTDERASDYNESIGWFSYVHELVLAYTVEID